MTLPLLTFLIIGERGCIDVFPTYGIQVDDGRVDVEVEAVLALVGRPRRHSLQPLVVGVRSGIGQHGKGRLGTGGRQTGGQSGASPVAGCHRGHEAKGAGGRRGVRHA